MNITPKHIKIMRIIFLITVLLLFVCFLIDQCASLPGHPKTDSAEATLTGETEISSGDAVSETDTASGSDAASNVDAEPAPALLTQEELNAFWDESVFIGDSVTLGLRNYAVGQRNKGNECLAGAQFLAMGNMSYSNSLQEIGTNDSFHPKYQGKEVTIEDGVRLTGAKNVFILLGMNDFCVYPFEECIKNAQEVVDRILIKCPDASIYIESVTPTLYDHTKFNNDNIELFNEELKKLCAKNGWTYVDIASVMKDAGGKFKKEFCSDPEAEGVHMDAEGCVAWIDYLNKFISNGGKTK